jgi:hypothetical protein
MVMVAIVSLGPPVHQFVRISMRQMKVRETPGSMLMVVVRVFRMYVPERGPGRGGSKPQGAEGNH